MSIRKMKLVRISAPASKVDSVIRACLTLETFHPENAADYVSRTMGYEHLNSENPYASMLSSMKELAAAYNFELDDERKNSKIKVDEHTTEFITDFGAQLKALTDQRAQLEEQIQSCKEAIEEYSHFLGLGLDFKEIFDCKFIRFRFGRLPHEGYAKLKRVYDDNPDILFVPCSEDDIGLWGVYFAPVDSAAAVGRIFASLQFERLRIPKAVGTAEEVVENLQNNIDIASAQLAEIDRREADAWRENENRLRSIYTKLDELNNIYEVRRYAVFHDKDCFVVGWIPAQHEPILTEKIDKITGATADFESPSDKKKPPTKLQNIILFRPFEYFVEMYGLPSYNEIDITPFVAITYTLLFGIMFGDLGQGLVVSLIGFILFKRSKSGLGKIMVPIGLSSAFFGLIFGSVFGFEEALDPLYHAIGLSGKPLSVMDSINTVLLVAISIGIAMVVLAMLMCVWVNIKKKRFGTAFFSESGVVGIVTYLSGVSLVYQFMSKKAIIPAPAAAALLIVGLLILYNKELIAGSIDARKFQKPESWSDYFMQNFFEVIEYILSYFSNTVSFLRVGAFVIVHASMMMVIFTLAGDPKSIGGIIVIVLGNVLVIALEGLLSGIQGLRLEFYEMFSRFFEGEGTPFNPIKSIKAQQRN